MTARGVVDLIGDGDGDGTVGICCCCCCCCWYSSNSSACASSATVNAQPADFGADLLFRCGSVSIDDSADAVAEAEADGDACAFSSVLSPSCTFGPFSPPSLSSLGDADVDILSPDIEFFSSLSLMTVVEEDGGIFFFFSLLFISVKSTFFRACVLLSVLSSLSFLLFLLLTVMHFPFLCFR